MLFNMHQFKTCCKTKINVWLNNLTQEVKLSIVMKRKLFQKEKSNIAF